MPAIQQPRWPCDACGAAMHFSPRSGQLACPHCGNSKPMPDVAAPTRQAALVEHDLHTALRGSLPAAAMEETRFSRCPGCGAELEIEGKVEATTCPFCATPVVPAPQSHRQIRPQALLPFTLTEAEAKKAMSDWLGNLWFAPSKLQQYARKGRALSGIYVPFWTHDADTQSRYSGMRGDAYYVTETVTVMVDGKPQRQQRQVRKIRWSPARGRVARQFDDVLVTASTSLPREHIEALAPWPLGGLQPYDPDYMSGFQAEAYTVALDQGHQWARQIMAARIQMDVRQDIGGDEQRINSIETDYSHETFKHILLPVWAAAYKYGGKSYRFVVNGQTGKVKGERPYSAWKIAFAVLAALLAAAAFAYVAEMR